MTQYNPDNWVIIEIANGNDPIFYKVLGGWSGGYLNGDSWRMNSGITNVTEDYQYYYFHSESGSIYKCYKQGNQLSMAIAGTWEALKDKFGDKVKLVHVSDIR